jgi:hypothetical protein
MFKLTQNKLSNHGVKIRLIKLSLFSLPISAAFFYSYTDYSSPLLCPIRAFTGIPCPGCGMTRSFLSLVQGNLGEAFSYHLFGPILFFFCLLAAIHLFLEIVSQRKIKALYVKILNKKTIQGLILPSILIYYLSRLLIIYGTGELAISFRLSPLANLIYN